MKKKIYTALAIALTPMLMGTGVLEYRDYKFKDTTIDDDSVAFQGISSTPPSLTSITEKLLNQASTLPAVASYANSTSSSFSDVTFSTVNTNSSLKESGVNYNSDFSTDDLVFTGYSFSSGLIFPIDLRQDRSLGSTGNIPNKRASITLTSAMGFRSISISSGYHNGIDLSGGVGENGKTSQHNYYAPIDCQVIYKGTTSSYGNIIGIQFTLNDEYVYRMYFAHMTSMSDNIKQGTTIKQGTYLGRMGSTGNSTGNHLHWEAIRMKASSADSIPTYPPLINTSGSSAPFRLNYTSNTINCILKSEYKEAEAISFDPTRLYGNTGTGQSYLDWFSSLGITVSSSSANEIEANKKVPFAQIPSSSVDSLSYIPFPEPKDYNFQ